MLTRIYSKIKTEGISGLVKAVSDRLFPKRLEKLSDCRLFFEDKNGLEIGGPSGIFSKNGVIPIYTIAARIDNINFGQKTIWEGNVQEGATFHFSRRRPPGLQFVAEANNLASIGPGAYDFVLSSHCLEHIANPLLALSEWIRILKEKGILVLVLPHKDATFDHRRPVTQLEHLISDFENRITECDMTHLDEILKLHDLKKDSWAGDFNAFRQRSMKNLENRCLHHHVFDTFLAVETINYMGLQILAVELFRPHHIIVIGQKTKLLENVNNDSFRGIKSAPCWRSPFPSDKKRNQRLN